MKDRNGRGRRKEGKKERKEGKKVRKEGKVGYKRGGGFTRILEGVLNEAFAGFVSWSTCVT